MAVYNEEQGEWICTECGHADWEAPLEGKAFVHMNDLGEYVDAIDVDYDIDTDHTRCACCDASFSVEFP